jgi:hypothetical protein
MTSVERQRHNALVTRIYTLIAQIRYDIDLPGYEEKAAATFREICRLAQGEAQALGYPMEGG